MNNVVSLDELFHKRLFRVPDYQRGYSWEHQQIREFLEDLELLTDSRYHYTGTVVLHESDDKKPRMDTDGNAYALVDIVDGQQRLTTIVMVLDEIRRALSTFSDTSKGLSQGIVKNFVSTQEINGQPLFKLSLNSDTDHFFRNSILAEEPGVEGPQITSERHLAEAKKQIAEYIGAKSDPGEGNGEDWLRSLYKKLATQLRFSLYEVEDEAEVGVIFEVMNDRGKPLTDLEKVKNYLLHVSTSLVFSNDLGNAVNSAWAEILRQLMSAGLVSSDDEDRLLRSHWLAYHNPQLRRWQGSRSVKQRFGLRNYAGRHQELLNDLLAYTEGLRESSIIFSDAYQPNRTDAFASFKSDSKARAEVVDWSTKLRRTGYLATFLPLLIAVRRWWPEDPDKYLRVLKLCETFAFRVYRWSEYRSNSGQPTIFRLAFELATMARTYEETLQAFKGHLAYWCRNDNFNDEHSGGDPNVWYRWGGLRYFLYEYETALASQQGASPVVPWGELTSRDLKETVEHILPQSISNQPYWKDRFNRHQHQSYVHDLGNLTLTKHNSYYQNKPFPDKRGSVTAEGHCYAKSPFFVERQLTELDDWNAAAIDQRRGRFLEWARGRWAVESSEASAGEFEPEDQDEDTNEDDIAGLDGLGES